MSVSCRSCVALASPSCRFVSGSSWFCVVFVSCCVLLLSVLCRISVVVCPALVVSVSYSCRLVSCSCRFGAAFASHSCRMRAHSCLLLPRPPRSLPLPPPVPYPPLPSSSSSPLTSANSLCTGWRPRLAFPFAVPFRAQACSLMQPSARSCSAGRLSQQAHWSGLLRRGCWSVMRSRGPPMMSPRFVPTA